jgi:hypothetical protein
MDSSLCEVSDLFIILLLDAHLYFCRRIIINYYLSFLKESISREVISIELKRRITEKIALKSK